MWKKLLVRGCEGVREGWDLTAYGFNLLVFAGDVVAEVLLQSAHCDHGVVADSLDHLQGGKETVLMNALQNLVQFIACFLQDLWT